METKNGTIRKITLAASAVVMTIGLISSFSMEAQASGSENGRPLKSDGAGTYCCENSGDDCAAACC